jgi:hypothetical protein
MGTAFIELRGEEYEVKYQDHGYEPDTNAHDITWEFTKFNNQHPPTDITDDEYGSIDNQIRQRSLDYADNEDNFL